MRLSNAPDRFGLVSKALHWAMAAGILAMLALGLTLVRIEVSLSTLWLFALHKSLGISLLALALTRLAWHRVSPPPRISQVAPWRQRLVTIVRRTLYALMFAVPLTGWTASGASGLDVLAWGIPLPSLAPLSETWETAAFAVHMVLTRVLMAALALHIAGALHGQFVRRDGTLSRMF